MSDISYEFIYTQLFGFVYKTYGFFGVGYKDRNNII